MTKPFADFKEDLTLFCSENKIDNDKISIVGVSKKKSLEDILSLYELGLRDFGENYAQELNEKSLALDSKKIRWHFMGPIQTNKIGLIVKNSYLVHSVDREKVLRKMDFESKKINKKQKVLVQVNISGEDSKSGILPGDAEEFINLADSFDNLELNGLMFMPNINQDKVSHIKEIKDSVNLFNDMKAKRKNIQVLSLGTSSDYKECIKAGSNLIRVGEILFGPRV
ncbi:YggS family pyridoxal phosphate-dependent enzyme [Pseudomonadota bacterium]|nr:YggS family pyridoxal phosphate-dependent enzyme [Pseudomonadota bacterium]